jgi:hypothetical protein
MVIDLADFPKVVAVYRELGPNPGGKAFPDRVPHSAIMDEVGNRWIDVKKSLHRFSITQWI